jgi:replication fork protection complex subunit Csm3/Swi3
MVEKVGHKKKVMAARNEWINQSRPKATGDDEEDALAEDDDNVLPSTEPAQDRSVAQPDPAGARPQTPPPRDDGVPDDDDIYDATPRASRPAPSAPAAAHGFPDDDELDELMAEYGALDEPAPQPRKQQPAPPRDEDDDDLDALVAEAEMLDQGKQKELPVRSDQEKPPAASAQEQELEGLWD